MVISYKRYDKQRLTCTWKLSASSNIQHIYWGQVWSPCYTWGWAISERFGDSDRAL